MDWDFKNSLIVLWRLRKVLKYLNNRQGEKLIIKRSKRGYHIFLWTRNTGNKFKIREELFDDKRHLAMDKLHSYGRQTLFSKKTKYKNGGKK